MDDNLAGNFIIIDQFKIKQVFINLIRNAIKFTAAGKIVIKLGYASAERFSISVTDTGIGIPQDKQKEIFEFFRQANKEISVNYGGLGIGLAISKKLADIMNAEIEVKSEVGTGSIFTFNFPIKIKYLESGIHE